GSDDAAAKVLFATLRMQEWINQRVMLLPNGGTRVILDVEPELLKRLYAYYRDRTGMSADARRRVADALRQATLDADLGTLDWTTFDSALRVFEAYPNEAAEWWRAVEGRFLAEREPDWILQMTRSLLGSNAWSGERQPNDPYAMPRSVLRPL